MALSGLKVVEIAGLAPGPLAGLILADNGADVLRIDRRSSVSTDILCRGKRSIAINLKAESGRNILKRLIASADVLIDPFRPGILEKLGLGPEVFLGPNGLNKRLIYARLVGFPRTGPHKNMAGHDINYLALSGVLSMMPGGDGKPSIPLNLLADMAGGGLTCALGILLALIERGVRGHGQVVDTDMVSGTRYVSSFPLLLSMIPSSSFSRERGDNLLDGGAPFYNVYTCKDGRWMSVGCLEPQFFSVFLSVFTGSLPKDFALEDGWVPTLASHSQREEWPRMKDYLTKGFLTQPRDYWANRFYGTDACTLPVLDVQEAAELDPSGSTTPQAHPRISNYAVGIPGDTLQILSPGQDTEDILNELGLSEDEREALIREGAIDRPARQFKL